MEKDNWDSPRTHKDGRTRCSNNGSHLVDNYLWVHKRSNKDAQVVIQIDLPKSKCQGHLDGYKC
jgi:hypothetical protein